MTELKYVDLGPKEDWPQWENGKEPARGKHGTWYEYTNQSRRNEALKKMKTVREQCLRKGTDIKRIILEYSGYGDSGDEFYALVDNDNKYQWGGYPGNGDDNLPELKKYLGDKWEDTVFDGLFQLLPGGWEINEGSNGHLIWDVKENKVQVFHNWNVQTIEEENSEATLNFEGI